MGLALGLLARLKFLRATPFDPFGYGLERKRERALIADYEAVMDEVLAGLNEENWRLAVELADLPQDIRGFGHVKEAAITRVEARKALLLAQWRDPASPADLGAEAAD